MNYTIFRVQSRSDCLAKSCIVSYCVLIFTCFIAFQASANSEIERAAAPRVISTDAFVTDIVVALAATATLVGIDVTSSVPDQYRDVPNIGYHRNLSAEGLLSLSPTMVIGSEHMGPPHVLSALRSAQVPVIRLQSADTINVLRANINIIAEVLGRESKAAVLQETIGGLEERILNNPLQTERIAFLLTVDESSLRMAGSGTNAAAFISLLGAQNAATFQNYQSTSVEALLSTEPSLVLVASREQGTAARLIDRFPVLRHSKAYKRQRIVDFDASSIIAGLSVAALHEAQRVIQLTSQGSTQTMLSVKP